MITDQELLQIKHYLKSRKLSDSVLNEVYDHFLPQISDLMMHENISFQEAFLKTKFQWKYELEMVKADIFTFKKIARIEKSILQMRFFKMSITSLVLSVLSLALAHIHKDLIFVILFLILILFVLSLGYNFIFKKMKFKEYINLSYHPLLVRNQVLFFGLIFLPEISNRDTSFFLESNFNIVFLIFCAAIQIQILYFRTKKVNVLI